MDVGNRHFRYPACPCGVTASMTAFQAVDTGSIPVMGSKYFSVAEISLIRRILSCQIISSSSSTVLGNRLISDDTGFDSLGLYLCLHRLTAGLLPCKQCMVVQIHLEAYIRRNITMLLLQSRKKISKVIPY